MGFRSRLLCRSAPLLAVAVLCWTDPGRMAIGEEKGATEERRGPVTIVLPGESLAAPYVRALTSLETGLGERGLGAVRVVLRTESPQSKVTDLLADLGSRQSAAVVAVGSRVFARLHGRDLSCPLVFTMVLNPARIDPSGVTPGVRLDCDPSDVLGVFGKLFPERQTIGVIYDSKTSSGLVEEIQKRASAHGLSLQLRTPVKSDELFSAQRELAERVEAFILVPDAYSASRTAFDALRRISFERRLPIVALKTSSVRDGAAMCFVVDYAEVGRQTAEVVGRVVRGKGGLGPSWPRSAGLSFNRNTLKYMGARTLEEGLRRRVVKWYPEEGTEQ